VELIQAAPLFDEARNVRGSIAAFWDITKFKEAEEQVKRSEERFRALVENNFDAIVLLDADSTILYASPSSQRILGYEPALLIGANAAELLHSTDLPKARSATSGIINAPGDQARATFRVRHADGSWRWVEAALSNLLDNPAVGAIVVNFHDVTEKKATEQVLATRMRQREVLARLGQLGVHETDLDGFMTDAARETAHALEAEYCKILEMLPDRANLLLKAAVGWKEDLVGRATIGSGNESQAGYTLQSKHPVIVEDVNADARFTGSALFHDAHITSSMSVVIEGHTGPYGVIGVGTPHRRKFTDDDINFLRSVAHLLSAAVERHNNERLRSEFLGMVTHELRSPLAAIKSAIALLEGEAAAHTGDIPELLSAMNSQADRVLALVGNLLDMAQIEAGAFSVNPKPTDLGSVVDAAVTNFAALNRVDVRLSVAGDLPPVEVDDHRIVQVMANLLSNAARYHRKGTPIKVALSGSPEGVRVSVRNTGTPIPVEQIPLLFRKFSRLDDGNRIGSGGTGLGLAISKGIVEAHGGTIWAASDRELEEVEFTFSIPTAGGWVGKGRPSMNGTKPNVSARQTNNVVIIDDEPLLLRHLEKILARAGYETAASTNPREAIELIQRTQPSIVLLDVIMPGMNGFEVLKELRKTSAVPVIFVSASNREEDKVRGLGIGADDYVTKPFSEGELLARIARAIDRHTTLPH
jgi:PAS domain S-box-containing protein